MDVVIERSGCSCFKVISILGLIIVSACCGIVLSSRSQWEAASLGATLQFRPKKFKWKWFKRVVPIAQEDL